MAKELLFSLTEKDFEFQFFVGSGNGGQARQKTKSACRCVHPPSGATGKSQDHREQSTNKKEAFQRCVAQPVFQKWMKIEVAKATGVLAAIEEKIDRELRNNVKVDMKDENGRWVEYKEAYIPPDKEPKDEQETDS